MKKVTEKMLSDVFEDIDLLEYINDIEDSIEGNSDLEQRLDQIIDNILNAFKEFKDVRYLRASNITAVGELLRMKKDIMDDKVKNKKSMLDTVMKKRQSDQKNNTLLAIEEADNKPMDLYTFLQKLDEKGIHPIIDAELVKESEVLIDTKGETLAIESDTEYDEDEEDLEDEE